MFAFHVCRCWAQLVGSYHQANEGTARNRLPENCKAQTSQNLRLYRKEPLNIVMLFTYIYVHCTSRFPTLVFHDYISEKRSLSAMTSRPILEYLGEDGIPKIE